MTSSSSRKRKSHNKQWSTKRRRESNAQETESNSGSGTTSTPRKRNFWTSLRRLIDSFIRKDAYGFFLQPVDVNVVTDYLSVIRHPMDLGTIQKKIEDRVYETLDEFREDVSLVCNNARIYNRPDTIYYREAERLWSYAERSIAREEKYTLTREESERPALEIEEGGEDVNGEVGGEGMPGSPPISSAVSQRSGHGSIAGDEEVDIVSVLGEGTPMISSTTASGGSNANRAQSSGSNNATASYEADTSRSAANTPAPAKKPAYHNIRRRKYVDASFRSLADGSFKEFQQEQWEADLPHYGQPPMLRFPVEGGKPGEMFERPATLLDYGAYATLAPRNPPPSAERAMYLFSTYGDEIGEAYARSLEAFTKDMPDNVKLIVHERLNRLSEGAHAIVRRVVEVSAQAAAKAMRESMADADKNDIKTEQPIKQESIET